MRGRDAAGDEEAPGEAPGKTSGEMPGDRTPSGGGTAVGGATRRESRHGPDAGDERTPTRPSLAWIVARGWAPYCLASVGLYLGAFATGALIGAERRGAIVPVRAAGDPVPDLSTVGLFTHNVEIVGWLVVGAALLGLPTAYGLATNGFLHGAVFQGALAAVGPATTLATFLPHGVVELPALWLGCAIAFRWVHYGWKVASGVRDRILFPRLVLESVLGLTLVVVGLVVAAWIEANVSVAML